MQTITKLADLATLGAATVDNLNIRDVRVLALFIAARRHGKVEWRAGDATIALLAHIRGEYGVTVDGVRSATGTIVAIFETVKQLSAALEERPSPAARYYKQFGFWADVQNDRLVQYVTDSDGGWEHEPLGIEYACSHMVERVNADFGTAFTMDDFEEGDCYCDD